MKKIIITLFGLWGLLLFAGTTLTASAADDDLDGEFQYTEAEIEKALLSLREGAKDAEVDSAKFVIENAGKTAFAVLVKHLDNKTTVSLKHFKTLEWEVDAKTLMAVKRKTLTIGDVAFSFLQEAIEDDFPREFKFFQVLTPQNVGAWLKKNQFLSIYEMRRVAAKESLAKAEAQYRIDRSEHTQTAITYLKGLVTRYSIGS